MDDEGEIHEGDSTETGSLDVALGGLTAEAVAAFREENLRVERKP